MKCGFFTVCSPVEGLSPVIVTSPDLCIATDASSTRCGIVILFERKPFGHIFLAGKWDEHNVVRRINWKETHAVKFRLQALIEKNNRFGVHTLLQGDSTTFWATFITVQRATAHLRE